MPNPSGLNQLGQSPRVFERQPPYGAQQRKEALARSVEAAGQRTSASAIDTPRRSKRRAVRGDARNPPATSGMVEPTPVMAAPPPPPPAPTFDPNDMLYFLWSEIADHPEASPLASQLAEQARRRISRG